MTRQYRLNDMMAYHQYLQDHIPLTGSDTSDAHAEYYHQLIQQSEQGNPAATKIYCSTLLTTFLTLFVRDIAKNKSSGIDGTPFHNDRKMLERMIEKNKDIMPDYAFLAEIELNKYFNKYGELSITVNPELVDSLIGILLSAINTLKQQAWDLFETTARSLWIKELRPSINILALIQKIKRDDLEGIPEKQQKILFILLRTTEQYYLNADTLFLQLLLAIRAPLNTHAVMLSSEGQALLHRVHLHFDKMTTHHDAMPELFSPEPNQHLTSYRAILSDFEGMSPGISYYTSAHDLDNQLLLQSDQYTLCYSGNYPSLMAEGAGGYMKLNEMVGALSESTPCVADFGSSQIQIYYTKEASVLSLNASQDDTPEDPITVAYLKFKDSFKKPNATTLDEFTSLMSDITKRIGVPVGLIQIGSAYKDKHDQFEALIDQYNTTHTKPITFRVELCHLSGIQRVNSFNTTADPEIITALQQIHQKDIYAQLKTPYYLMGTTGAAHYGRDEPKDALDTLNRMTPQATPSFDKREPYSFVSKLITRLYPDARSIITKLIKLSTLTSAYAEMPALAAGQTGAGSNPGCWVLFENGDFAAFEFPAELFKPLRGRFKKQGGDKMSAVAYEHFCLEGEYALKGFEFKGDNLYFSPETNKEESLALLHEFLLSCKHPSLDAGCKEVTHDAMFGMFSGNNRTPHFKPLFRARADVQPVRP